MFLRPIIAHRGFSGKYPENTMTAFKKAAELGVKCIETDITILGDKTTPVLFHDYDLQTHTNYKGSINDLAPDDLAVVDAGSWKGEEFKGEKIPLLEDLLKYAKEQDLVLNLELKGERGINEVFWWDIVENTCNLVAKYDVNVFYSSFEVPMLEYLVKLQPDAEFGLLVDNENWEGLARELSPKAIHILDSAVTEDVVRHIKSGYEMYVYTVNDTARADVLFKWGVDGIFTDYPDKFDKKLY